MVRSLCVTLGLVYLLLAGASPAAAQENYPHIRHSIFELREAKTELEKAEHNFGGHRKEAIKIINVAIEELENALKVVKAGKVAKGEPKPEIYKKYPHNPHIHHAVVELKECIEELEKAPPVFEGHRVKAIKATKGAVEQLELCLKHVK